MRKLKNEELNRPSIEEYQRKPKYPLVLVLDNIRSLNNVGSAFRTADAFLIERVYLCGITGRPPHREINKTALGATESVEWEYFAKVEDAIQDLKEKSFKIVVIEQVEGSVSLKDFNWVKEDKYALVFGNEVFGVSEGVLDQADIFVEIPQFGTKHSLNVAVSIGVVAWEFVSRRKDFNSS